MQTAKTLIRLGGCPGWSESSLDAHSICWFYHVAAQIHRWVLYNTVYQVLAMSIGLIIYWFRRANKLRTPCTAFENVAVVALFASLHLAWHPALLSLLKYWKTTEYFMFQINHGRETKSVVPIICVISYGSLPRKTSGTISDSYMYAALNHHWLASTTFGFKNF